MKQTKCYCGHTTTCDCGPLEEPKQSTKDRIMSETSEETKQKARDYGNSLVNKQEQDKNLYSEEDMIAFGKSCFYKGFEKAENDDANCYTAFREQIGSLVKQFKKK